MLPVDFRNRLGLRPGDEVRISEESDGSLRVESRRTAAHALIGLAGSVEHSVLEDLAADRRDQVAADDAQVAGPRRARAARTAQTVVRTRRSA
jgi:bifunctional DNA-binding transcriptional regulator/antitoxin component of YhaV-PrlF toxin-antitoxin module